MMNEILGAITTTDTLLWTHGFLAALALRRGRIKIILDTLFPTTGDSDE